MCPRHNELRRGGFTMIELLITIGIIVILVGIALIGFKAVQGNAASRRTDTMLGNAASMLAEYDSVTSLKKQPRDGMWPPTTAPSRFTGMGIDIWSDNDPTTAGVQRLIAPGLVDEGEPDRLGNAVRNTAVVLGEMAKVPGVGKVFSQIPTESKMTVGVATTGGTFSPLYENQPVLLDGWGNPIIFVPAAGMTGVTTVGGTYVITSIRSYPVASAPSLVAGLAPPGARPYFASAGPDGNFTTGDDNRYSFGK